MDSFPSNFKHASILAWSLCAIMFTTCIHSSDSKIHCNEKDKQILLNFKNGAIDPSGLLSTWFSQQDCCHWYVVVCHNFTSRVTQLNLPCSFINGYGYNNFIDKSHCLSGDIPISLLQMEFLEHLDLSNHDFLAMTYNSMNNLSLGNLPYQCGNSSSLHYLDLLGNLNLLIHNLEWLSSASSLKYIDLSGIDLRTETNWVQLMAMLPSLSELYLVDCHLDNMSPSLHFANFTALEVLDLSVNAIYSEVPNWLFNLTCDISYIYLDNNLLRGELPKAMPNFQVLKYLVLSNNDLNGPIPDCLGKLEHLTYLDLSSNLFSGPLPINLGNLSSLVALKARSNYFTGVVSEKHFTNLSNLKFLFVESPNIIFDFDLHWIPPFQLDGVFLGPVGPKPPQWLYTQTSLKSLGFANSKFSFETGDKFWSFVSKIELLQLVGNSIDGDLSNVLLNSSFIQLSSNNLKGGLPRLSSSVRIFMVDNNSLSGSMVPLLCHDMDRRSNLEYLDMSNNKLSGGLTDYWTNWKSLLHINLGNNDLSGKIPPSMGLLENLTSLHLHENNLSGDIPLSLQNCHSLLILNVRENRFSGSIPNWLPHKARALQLRSNQFTGTIPPQICQMHSLTILDFADNRISGHIPSCINNITAMVVHVRSVIAIGYIFYIDGTRYIIPENLMLLMKSKGLEYEDWNLIRIVDLSSNDLLGTMPAQMFRLTELHSLNLSHNQLVGKIPKEIGNMRELESLIYQGINFQGHNFKALVHSATLEILIFVDLHLQKVTHMMVYLEAQSLWMLLLLMMMISLSFGHLSIKNNSV
nr:receptor-like protein EIX2 [Arachis hypogaea]